VATAADQQQQRTAQGAETPPYGHASLVNSVIDLRYVNIAARESAYRRTNKHSPIRARWSMTNLLACLSILQQPNQK
jgi:hypothetical protein